LNVDFISVGVKRCRDAIGVAADRAVFDVLLTFAATRVGVSIDTTAAVGAPVFTEHVQVIGLVAKMRQSTNPFGNV